MLLQQHSISQSICGWFVLCCVLLWFGIGCFYPYPSGLLNPLAPGRSECHSKNVIFSLVLLIGIFRSSHDNALRRMTQDLTDDKSTLVQVMAWCLQATRHYLSQCWLSSLSPYGVARPQWVNSFWPGDVIWWQRTGSTLAPVMACCLTAPSHYLNHCWLIIR